MALSSYPFITADGRYDRPAIMREAWALRRKWGKPAPLGAFLRKVWRQASIQRSQWEIDDARSRMSAVERRRGELQHALYAANCIGEFNAWKRETARIEAELAALDTVAPSFLQAAE